MRDTIIFTGASNTFGLGLEIELRDKYNDDAWLKENGMQMPNPREPEDVPFWKEHRWTKLVSDELGLIEHNIHDAFLNESHPMGGNSIETLWILNRDSVGLKPVLDRTKYIIFEMGWIRWWDENLHGKDKDIYPNTILEIINLINNPSSNQLVVSESLEWIKNLDEGIYWRECFKKYKYLKESYPEIQFVMIPWVPNDSIKNVDSNFKNDFVDVGYYSGMYGYLKQNKLTIGDTAKAFNGDYEFNYKDDHPSKLGHRHVANFVINHINKNNNLETIPFKK